MLRRPVSILVWLFLLVVVPLSATVWAEPFPTRPIRLIAGALGSVSDIIARPLADALSGELRQRVVVENHPGAGGILAMKMLSLAKPDGHTLAIASTSQLVYNSYLFDALPYDPVRDVTPITRLVTGKVAIVANPAFR